MCKGGSYHCFSWECLDGGSSGGGLVARLLGPKVDEKREGERDARVRKMKEELHDCFKGPTTKVSCSFCYPCDANVIYHIQRGICI